MVSKLQTYVNKCLRRIPNITWPNKILNTELLERSDVSRKQRKWRWLGHTLRKGQDDITNQSLKWNPQGNRKVGRPKSTWKRELKKEINKTLSEASTVAASKEKWKDLVRGVRST